MLAMHVIKRPVITERSMKDADSGKFTFIVATHATKKEIRQAIEKLFTVNVIGIATIMIKGKSVRGGVRRQEIAVSPIKKAIVKLASGQKISAFEVGAAA